ncbi:hypothetical protein [Pseudaquidulcibacter saccharophilus]|uniref:hypothetical protein n=1 Tax=Pseudaquidulcibacter saccharophilus TaxID=2831900 RepID=UPI001EFF4744|nr:hypothetical protein [Pseudaquidulcibacter saccharophilus]
MKNIVKYGFMSLSLLMVATPSYSQSVLKKMNMQEQLDTVQYIYPKTNFDEEYTKNAVALGNSTINGVLFYKITNDGSDAALLSTIKPEPVSGHKVFLYPYTPYLVDYINLSKKQARSRDPQKRKVMADDRMFIYSYYSVTDNYGRFSFGKMKPGKYLLSAEKMVSGYYYTTVATGRAVSDFNPYYGQVGVTQYENQKQNWSALAILEKVVEVKEDGKIVEVDARLMLNPDRLIK